MYRATFQQYEPSPPYSACRKKKGCLVPEDLNRTSGDGAPPVVWLEAVRGSTNGTSSGGRSAAGSGSAARSILWLDVTGSVSTVTNRAGSIRGGRTRASSRRSIDVVQARSGWGTT